MRKLFAALTRSAFADRVSFSRKVSGKNPNDGTTKDRFLVEKLRGSLFDLFSQSEKLLHTCAAFCSLRSREFIKRGIADLTHDNLVVVQHEKPESVSLLVMPLDFMTDQRHGQHSPQTDAGSPRLPQPASQINGLTATLSRKLLTFLIALASIAFGVCSPAFAQSSPILGFPPGVFDNLAARSPASGGGGGSIALVPGQLNFNFSFSSVTSLLVSLPNNPTAGNLVGVCFALNDPGAHTPITIQDGDGNSYTLSTSSPYVIGQSGNVFNLGIGFLQNAPAPVSNSKTITVTWTGAVGARVSWSRLSEQNLRIDKWSLCRV